MAGKNGKILYVNFHPFSYCLCPHSIVVGFQGKRCTESLIQAHALSFGPEIFLKIFR